MSERFKASNGIEVAWKQEGTIPVLQTNAEGCTARVAVRPGWEVVGAQHPDSSGVGFGKGSETHKALREFFQHERDEELGRWRWPENPDYVVYPLGDIRVDVLRESSVSDEYRGPGRQTGIDRDTAERWSTDAARNFYAAARAYFAAHPEPEPLPSEPHTAWVDKYGTDIWWVDGLGKLRCCASPSSDPAKYAPFTRLVPEVSDGA